VRQSAENRLKKKGLYYSILAPSFLSDLSTAFTLLKCEIISWDWYNITLIANPYNKIGYEFARSAMLRKNAPKNQLTFQIETVPLEKNRYKDGHLCLKLSCNL
jgi:hypothetical protein